MENNNIRNFISVIMSVYNAEKCVLESISSILNQTFIDFEMIIIDNGSTDNSWAVIQSISDERMITKRNENNTSQYTAYNYGIKISKGKYLVVLEANDISLPERLRKQYDYMENNLSIWALGTQFAYYGSVHTTEIPVTYQEICSGLLEENCIPHSSLFIRSDSIRQTGGYDEHYKDVSEYDLICRLCLAGKIEILPETLIIRHYYSEQISPEKKLEYQVFSDKIRQKYQIAFINKNKSLALPPIGEAETDYPDMGRVIGLFIMSECFHLSYRNSAEQLLNLLIENINSSTPLCLKKGLLSIGMGSIYLLRNHFVLGDEDDILESIDVAVYFSIFYYKEGKDFDWEGIFYYLRKRAMMPSSHNLLTRLRIKKTILHLLDIYKCYKDKIDFGFLEKELDNYCENNLFKGLISSYRDYTSNSKETCKCRNIIDASSVAFVIPVRIDSEERKNNLFVVIGQLLSIENSKIILLEADNKPGLDAKKFNNRVHYHFFVDKDPIFYRTRYINKLLEIATNPIIGIWDTDVLVEKGQIEESIRQIKEEGKIMSFPYDGRFYVLSPALSDTFRTNPIFEIFEKQNEKLNMAFGTYCVGGAFLINKEMYCQIGGENERFYGWGAEDNERVKRLEILGYRIHRSNGVLYHLYHPRNNSHYADHETESMTELIKVSNMTREELMLYIKTWH